jgi:formate C-acetyltransferase
MATAVRTGDELAAATRDLRQEVLRDAAPYAERLLLVAEAFRESEGEVYRGLRMARTTRHLFEHMPVKIRRGEILLGWHPSSHPDEAAQEAIEEARKYLQSQTYWVPASEGHMAPDYEALLRDGIGGTLERIDKLRAGLDPADPETPEKEAFYDSARLSVEALQLLIRRYGDLAREMSAAADEPWWAEELDAAADLCERIATEPAETFREAMQLMWFLYLAVCLEGSEHHHCFGPGRPDQYLLPYYRRDREAGRLDDATLHALLDQLFIKCNEFQGRGMSAVILVLGGRRPDGADATNELSYEFLDASDRVRMYFPGCDVSWHQGMDEEFMRRAVSLLRNGNGQPSFFNDEAICRGLVNAGIPFEHAVDHLPSTCTETSIAGRTNPWVAWPYCNLPMDLLYALFGGLHPATGAQDRPAFDPPQTYAQLHDAFFRQLKITAEDAVATTLRAQWQASMYRLFPLLSTFIQDCLGRGRDIARGGCLYTFLQPEAVGTSNVVDGLAAVRTLVEEQGRYTLDDFRAAVRANFEGHKELRQAIRGGCPKHGNDVDWVNDLFAEVAGSWCDSLEQHTSRYGQRVFPGFLGWTVWIRFGEQTPATPDGRLDGEPLANSLANCTGVQVKGFPSVILSAAEFDQSRGLGGITFNVRVGANSLAADGGVERLKGLIEAAFDLGTYQVQVDLASSEVLRDAQEHPESYDDLFVRIGGYLVPFTLLGEQAQADIIARTELEL